MAAFPRTDRYDNVAIALHWGIAALVLFNLFLGIGHDALPDDWKVMPVHKAVGITILFLSIGRLGWRLAHQPVPFDARLKPWEKVLASATHWIFYALLIIVPLTGWMMVSGAEVRRPLTFFGLFDIPYLPVGESAGDFGHEAHELLGLLMAGLAAIHILAALAHHIVRRDATLTRMIPFLKPRG
ncbi:cytochrome b [Sphingomonas sp. LT1P40]|uniref:cytochrome b n=1 Tax=Alteristakelama amylovorans TaxID=3096166 RepID=UPI002FC63345